MDNETINLQETIGNSLESSGNAIPKFNVPSQMSYGDMSAFKTLNGSQIEHEVITDTYVTSSGNEDEMMKQLDNAASILMKQQRGFAGYLSFCYIQLTMFYILKQYDLCLTALDRMLFGVDAIERYLVTDNFLDENNNDSGFINFTFGEDDDAQKQTLKYLHDAWNFAKMVHSKASSFESGYALIVASILLHNYNKQIGMIRTDCEHMRDLVAHMRNFITNERDNPVDTNLEASSDTTLEFVSELPDYSIGNISTEDATSVATVSTDLTATAKATIEDVQHVED